MLENKHCFVRLNIHNIYCNGLAYSHILATDAFLPVMCSREHDKCYNADVRKQGLMKMASSRTWRRIIDSEQEEAYVGSTKV